MIDFLRNILGKEAPRSKNIAKERLQLVLVHDRANISPHLLEDLKEDLIRVITNYMEIDENALEVQLNNDDQSVALVANIPVIKIYGNDLNTQNRVSIISFNLKGIDHRTLANILSLEAGIAVRNGCFCAQPYVQQLLKVSPKEIKKHVENPSLPHPGMVRLSFGLYNTYSEIDTLIQILNKVTNNKTYYLNKYLENSIATP